MLLIQATNLNKWITCMHRQLQFYGITVFYFLRKRGASHRVEFIRTGRRVSVKRRSVKCSQRKRQSDWVLRATINDMTSELRVTRQDAPVISWIIDATRGVPKWTRFRPLNGNAERGRGTRSRDNRLRRRR